MEKGLLEIAYSNQFFVDLTEIYSYGFETFGIKTADAFTDDILFRTERLTQDYDIYPECRHLETKSAMYRNIILGKYLIIYRIKVERVEILTILHGSRSISKIKRARGIKTD